MALGSEFDSDVDLVREVAFFKIQWVLSKNWDKASEYLMNRSSCISYPYLAKISSPVDPE